MVIRRNDEGAAAVEFALVLPLLLLIVCGIIDFGRAYHARITLSHSAREAVRVWALGGTAAEATTAAQASATGLTGVTITTTSCVFGSATAITVTAPFSYLTPLIAELAPATAAFSAEGVMRCGG